MYVGISMGIYNEVQDHKLSLAAVEQLTAKESRFPSWLLMRGGGGGLWSW